MIADRDRGREMGPIARKKHQSAALHRIADLETMIARQKCASSHLAAQGLPTEEVERIIDILVGSLQLVRDYQAAIADDCAGRDETRASGNA